MVYGRRAAGANRFLVNSGNLQLVPVLMYGSEARIWKKKERSMIRPV